MKAFALTLAGFLLPTFGLLADQAAPSKARVVDLRVERMTNPTAVNHPLPRFGWRIETEEPLYFQTSYRILAASTPELLAQGKGDLWDSEETPGRKTQFINFGGAPLTTGQVVHWKVQSKSSTAQFTPWSEPARFTVKLSGPPELPVPLFLTVSEAPRLSSFECSDPKLNKIYELAAQRLHEITSVRDIGLMMRAAAYHQEIHPRASAWLHHMNASIDAAGFYPASLPSDGTFGSTQSDAAISAAHSVWWMTADRQLFERNFGNFKGYIFARKALQIPSGETFGQLPEDTLPAGDPTPASFVDACTHALNLRLVLDMSRFASVDPYESRTLQQYYASLGQPFQRSHLRNDGGLNYDSITAHLLALRTGILSTTEQQQKLSQRVLELVGKHPAPLPLSLSPAIAQHLLPIMTWTGNHNQAVKLLAEQNPQNLDSMALACSSGWLLSQLAGIDTNEPGFQNFQLRPQIPERDIVSHSKATFSSAHGTISIHWYYEDSRLRIDVTIPPNTTAFCEFPVGKGESLTESGKELKSSKNFFGYARQNSSVTFKVTPGTYQFLIAEAD